VSSSKTSATTSILLMSQTHLPIVPQEPVAVLPLAYAEPETAGGGRSSWRRINRGALLASIVVTAGAWCGVLYHVESVLVGGPTLMALGALMVVGGLRRRQPWVWAIGTGHCAICMLFVALVNGLKWSPQDADIPFTVMGAAYNLISIPACVFAWIRRAG
jgi:hypothetical protein